MKTIEKETPKAGDQKKKEGRLRRHMPTKRRLIQLYAALLYNANLKGFVSGKIYTGTTKYLCLPGLNCYSCPGAVGACPLGALQNALASSNTKVPAYVFGIIILFGLLLGRTICGFLCPFGLIQELLHKIPSPKLKKNRFTRIFSYFKYVILVALVIMIPLALMDKLAVPGFCKYICPAGTLEGAIGLLSNKNNTDLFPMLGPLFTWKFCLLVGIIVASIFIFRFFCRFFCPLGAIYGFFCRLALIGVKLDKDKCVSCGLCVTTCKMDIRHVGDHECIHCGGCIPVCPTKAIHWSGSKYFIPTETAAGTAAKADEPADEAKIAESNAKIRRRGRILKIVAGILAGALLITALWYYNIYDRDKTVPDDPVSVIPPTTDTGEEEKVYGYQVGNYCPDFTLPGVGGDPDFVLSENLGTVVVINFWATWCGPCVNELPYFEQLSGEYADNLTVVAIHGQVTEPVDAYIENKGWSDWKVGFVLDTPQTDTDNQTVLQIIGKSDALPVTVIVDQEGKIIFRRTGSITYDQLIAAIAPALEDQ
ncbi:MAG: 4Fe-4S binding protein [Eubacteriales bacterium]